MDRGYEIESVGLCLICNLGSVEVYTQVCVPS